MRFSCVSYKNRLSVLTYLWILTLDFGGFCVLMSLQYDVKDYHHNHALQINYWQIQVLKEKSKLNSTERLKSKLVFLSICFQNVTIISIITQPCTVLLSNYHSDQSSWKSETEYWVSKKESQFEKTKIKTK